MVQTNRIASCTDVIFRIFLYYGFQALFGQPILARLLLLHDFNSWNTRQRTPKFLGCKYLFVRVVSITSLSEVNRSLVNFLPLLLPPPLPHLQVHKQPTGSPQN